MNLPCIKDKCLKYPVCRYKYSIVCKELEDYLMSNEGTWKKVHTIIPNLFTVTSKQGDEFNYRCSNTNKTTGQI